MGRLEYRLRTMERALTCAQCGHVLTCASCTQAPATLDPFSQVLVKLWQREEDPDDEES